MGLDNIPNRSTGQVIADEFWNVLKRVLGVDFVPRNVSGIPTANAGDLGTPTYPWKRANIKSGYWVCGDIKMFDDYNGALSPGQGWMKLNGDICNETNYNAIHGAGSWAAYIGSSPLDGKYLKVATDRYPVGKLTTTQNGASAQSYEGNAGNSVDLAHSHTVNSHTHTFAHTHSIANGFTGEGLQGSQSGSGASTTTQTQSTSTSGAAAPGTNSQLSSSQSIKPDSFQVQYWIRII